MSEIKTVPPVQAIDDLHRRALDREWWAEGQEPECWLTVGRWLDDVTPLDFWRNTGDRRDPPLPPMGGF